MASLEPAGLNSKIFVVLGSEDGAFNCLEAAPGRVLGDTSRRWRLSHFTKVHRRAILGSVGNTAPWGKPGPAGANYVWARCME
eukprot:13382159-Alexandrium_andersonii.AAC.1